MPKTCLTLFSGFGLADIGIKAAGFDIAGAVEREEAIAEVYRQNHGDHIICAPCDEVDYRQFTGVDAIWASPPCQQYSVARSKDLPEHEGKDAGYSVVAALDAIQPKYFFLENVRGYKESPVFHAIINKLYELGYFPGYEVLNAANYNVPQNRHRLIVRAVKGEMVPPMPLPSKKRGWYEAIAHQLEDCPVSELAEWQLKKLRSQFPHLFSGAGSFEKKGISDHDQPSPTICGNHDVPHAVLPLLASNGYRAKNGREFHSKNEPCYTIVCHSRQPQALLPLLAHGQSVNKYGDEFLASNEPVFTLKANWQPIKAIVDSWEVRALTPRCLADLQTVPDSFKLPKKKGLAIKGIGNGVPCDFAKAVVRSVG